MSGSIAFIDASETDGYLALGGNSILNASSSAVSTVLSQGGTVSSFSAKAGSSANDVTFTVYDGASATAITCTIAANANPSSCTSAASAAFAPGDSISVRVTHAGSGGPTTYLRNVGFAAAFTGS